MKKILLLEDDTGLRELVAPIFSDYHLVEAASVSEAMNCLGDKDEIAAAVIEYWMPDGAAVPVLDALKDRNPQVPVVVVSGGNNRFSPELTEALSVLSYASVFLHKPFSREELVRALASVLPAA